MSVIQDLVRQHTGYAKPSPSGWHALNCPLCTLYGQSRPDTRKRGGLRYEADGGVVYHCFNCGFKTGWKPGSFLGHKLKTLLRQIGVDDADIQRANITILQEAETQGLVLTAPKQVEQSFEPKWPSVELPAGTEPIAADSKASEYIEGRRLTGLYTFLSTSADWKFKNRVIIPYTYQDRLVGYAARYLGDTPNKNVPKLIRTAPQDYVFNLDAQNELRKFVLVVEGEFDAIAVDGVAVMHNAVSNNQAKLIEDLDRDIILVPDRDHSGLDLVELAAERGWSVSFPDWDHDIKDAADAVKRYGRIYTIHSILKNIQHNKLKIKIIGKKYCGR